MGTVTLWRAGSHTLFQDTPEEDNTGYGHMCKKGMYPRNEV